MLNCNGNTVLTMDALSKEIRKKGLTMKQFCEKVLNCEYKAFRARVRQNRLRLSEIKQIIIYTNLTFEQLFGVDPVPTSKNREENKLLKQVKGDNNQGNGFIDTWE